MYLSENENAKISNVKTSEKSENNHISSKNGGRPEIVYVVNDILKDKRIYF
jgi:hypothetical protein